MQEPFDFFEIPKPIKRPSVFAGSAAYWTMIVGFALYRLGLSPLYYLLSALIPINRVAFISAAQVTFYIGVLFFPLMGYLLVRGGMEESFRLNPLPPRTLLRVIWVAIAGFLAAGFLSELWMVLLEALGGDVLNNTSNILSGSLVLDLLLIAVLPGICEELMFRGMLMASFERYGTWKAIWITSVLFMLTHGSIDGMPAELMMGLVLGYTVASTGTLYASMGLHTLYNAITLMVSYSTDTGENPETVLSQIGGLGGVIQVLFVSVLFVMLLMAALKFMDRLRIKEGRPFGNDWMIEAKQPGNREIVLLISALATVLWFYADDAISLFIH